ncbi:unnamed protein product [Effrenium voratum]|nr:unnamed protein product [Effrenium voratum]
MGEKNASLDLDLQAVENIPRDTLVVLLRRKDKELKTLQGKLEKLEERYVKVVRFNKILMEDRQSFQRFCHELLPDCDGAFEEAAAQEAPTNLHELLRQLAEWRRNMDSACEDRKVFQQFLELVFPGEDVEVFGRPEALDLLQKKWIQLEDLHNQSIASINAMAREQALQQQEELLSAQKACQEAERKIQDLKEELTSMAREKAQVLKQKLHGKSQGWNNEAVAEANGTDSEVARALEEKAAAERREREAWQSLERQREAMQAIRRRAVGKCLVRRKQAPQRYHMRQTVNQSNVKGSCTQNHIFTFGPIYSFGIFLPFIKADLSISLTEVSTVSSTMNTAQFVGSLLAGLVIPKRLSHVQVAVFSALSVLLGLSALSFAQAAWHAYPAALVAGLGLGASNLAGLVALNASVGPSRRATMVGLATCGTSVGTILLPQFYNLLAGSLGWRWAMRINAAASCGFLLAAAPFFWVAPAKASTESKNSLPAAAAQAVPVAQTRARRCQPLRDPRFLCWWLDMAVCFFGYFGPSVLLAEFARTELQLAPEDAANCYTLLGVSALLTRLCLGFITHACGGPRRVHFASQILAGAMTCLMPFCWNFESLLVWSVLYGFSIGPVIALISVVLSELFGTQALALYHGISRVGVGTGNMLGVPVIGLLTESQGYVFALVLSGCVVIAGTGFLVILEVLHRRKLRTRKCQSELNFVLKRQGFCSDYDLHFPAKGLDCGTCQLCLLAMLIVLGMVRMELEGETGDGRASETAIVREVSTDELRAEDAGVVKLQLHAQGVSMKLYFTAITKAEMQRAQAERMVDKLLEEKAELPFDPTFREGSSKEAALTQLRAKTGQLEEDFGASGTESVASSKAHTLCRERRLQHFSQLCLSEAMARRKLLLIAGMCLALRISLGVSFVGPTAAPGALSRVALHARGGEGELVEHLLKPDVLLLDVRTVEEYEDGHVDGSANIPHTQIEQRASDLPKDKETPVVVFCAKGIRAAMAQSVLEKLGYTNVVNGMTWLAVQELTSNDFITHLAEQQALREVEMKKHQRQVQDVNQSLAEVQKMLQMSYAQEKVLKDRIRELESSQGRTHVAGDYLKHVVLKYIEYCQKGDMKSQSLVPVLSTLLNLNSQERKLAGAHGQRVLQVRGFGQEAKWNDLARESWLRVWPKPDRPSSIFVPAVHLESGPGQLVALTYRGIMLVLIFEAEAHIDIRLLESLRETCNRSSGDGLSLAELHPLIVPQHEQVMEQEDEYRFVYYNHTNHALRLSNQASISRSLLGSRVTAKGPKPAEKPLLAPMHATLADPKLKCREVSWKSAERGWVCAKRWCEREFYLLLDGTSTSLSRCQAPRPETFKAGLTKRRALTDEVSQDFSDSLAKAMKGGPPLRIGKDPDGSGNSIMQRSGPVGDGLEFDFGKSAEGALDDGKGSSVKWGVLKAFLGCARIWGAWPLRSISLCELRGLGSEAAALGAQLARLRPPTLRLQHLGMRGSALATCLEALRGLRLDLLDLSGNALEDEDLAMLLRLMSGSEPLQLSGLTLSNNPAISQTALRPLLAATQLSQLDLAECSIGPSGAMLLEEILPHCQLRDLSLYRSGIGLDGLPRAQGQGAGCCQVSRAPDVADGSHNTGKV